MVGALGCAGLLRLGVAPQWQLAGFGLALLPVYLGRPIGSMARTPTPHADENNSPFTLPTGPLLDGHGGRAGLYGRRRAVRLERALRQSRSCRAPAAMGALAFAAFSAAMAYGRLRDSVRARVAPPRLLRVVAFSRRWAWPLRWWAAGPRPRW